MNNATCHIAIISESILNISLYLSQGATESNIYVPSRRRRQLSTYTPARLHIQTKWNKKGNKLTMITLPLLPYMPSSVFRS